MRIYETPKSLRSARARAQPDLDPRAPGHALQLAALKGEQFDAQETALKPSGTSDLHRYAREGMREGAGALPFGAVIQGSFGRHDLSGVRAHLGARAAQACTSLGAEAYAMGPSVAFTRPPDLHTAAHEAAHIVQQRQGVSLSGGIGRSGDRYERQADQVADAVVAGRSAEGLLDPQGGSQTEAVQLRRLDGAADILDVHSEDQELAEVAQAVAAYNAVAEAVGPAGFQQRINLLQAVERGIYAWFREASTKNVRLHQTQHTDAMKALLAECEAEHEALIDASKDMEEVLPFDSSNFTPEELGQARALWRSIVDSQGNIKVSGSEGYQKRVRSELAKILGTPTGLRLLTFLNAPKTGEAGLPRTIGQIFISDDLSVVPEDVRNATPVLEDLDHSEAQRLGAEATHPTRATEAPHAGAAPEGYTTMGEGKGARGAHRDAVLGGGRGVVRGGQREEFGEGVGSFVTSFPGAGLNVNKETKEILTPSWVTLGHELGHSAHMKAGASNLHDKSAAPSDTFKQLAGGEEETKKWDNLEELLVIKNIENALRAETGQAKRDGHQAGGVRIAGHVKASLRAPFESLLSTRIWLRENHEFMEVYDGVCQVPANEVANDPAGYVARFQEDVARITGAAFINREERALLAETLGRIIEDPAKARAIADKIPVADLHATLDTVLLADLSGRRRALLRKGLHINLKGRILTGQDERLDTRARRLTEYVDNPPW